MLLRQLSHCAASHPLPQSMSRIVILVPIPDCANPVSPGRHRPLKSHPPMASPATPIDKIVSAGGIVRRADHQMWRDIFLPSLKGTSIRQSRERPAPPLRDEEEGSVSSDASSESEKSDPQPSLRIRKEPNPTSCEVQRQPTAAQDKSPLGDAARRVRKDVGFELPASLRSSSSSNCGKSVPNGGTAMTSDEDPATTDADLRELIKGWPMPSGVWVNEPSEDDVVPDSWWRAFKDEIQNIELRAMVKNWPVATGFWASGKRHNSGIRWPTEWYALSRLLHWRDGTAKPRSPPSSVDIRRATEKGEGKTSGRTTGGREGSVGKRSPAS